MENETRLLFIGRPEPQKGIADLLEALSFLNDYLWTLTIVGDYDTVQLFKLFSYFQSNQNRIRAVGKIPNLKLISTLKDHDLVVIPSHYETFGNVALEAMAASLPVIASSTGGLKTLIINGKNGLLFPPKNVHVLSEKLKFAFENPNKMKEMGQIGSKMAAKYAWEKIIVRTERLLFSYLTC